MSSTLDPHAPPCDLDVLAARQASQIYLSAVKRGVSKWEAWEEAVAAFGAYHPGWPMPLVEREAARTVGALIMQQRAAEAIPRKEVRRPPLDLLLDLATPETPETMRAAIRVEAMGASASLIFRGAWKVGARMRPTESRIPLGHLLIRESMPAA